MVDAWVKWASIAENKLVLTLIESSAEVVTSCSCVRAREHKCLCVRACMCACM